MPTKTAKRMRELTASKEHGYDRSILKDKDEPKVSVKAARGALAGRESKLQKALREAGG